jgi:hypothetical protein
MNDARRKEIQRALTLIGETKGILELTLSQEQDDLDNMPDDLQGDEEGQIAEDVVDALERAAMGCGDAITPARRRCKVPHRTNERARHRRRMLGDAAAYGCGCLLGTT